MKGAREGARSKGQGAREYSAVHLIYKSFRKYRYPRKAK
jgi:hypothetical protein